MGIKVFFSHASKVTDQDYKIGCRHYPSLPYLCLIEGSRFKPKLASVPLAHPHPNTLLEIMQRLLMKEDQAMQQITRGSDEKMINSDQDPISFCENLKQKTPVDFRQTQVNCMKNITGYLREAKLTHTAPGVPFALKLYDL